MNNCQFSWLKSRNLGRSHVIFGAFSELFSAVKLVIGKLWTNGDTEAKGAS